MGTAFQNRDKASFRDRSGFVFHQGGELFRAIHVSYRAHYDRLMQSGLYSALVERGLLIPHEETQQSADDSQVYRIIRPERISFVSYPYEWCFSQLKEAALATLRIQELALRYGMTLKDCSAYNIQFRGVKPLLIDTLSFERYEQGRPWIAYRQFCQHFLAPLALMSYVDLRSGRLLCLYRDGIPLDLASTLLPGRTSLRLSLLLHIHLHSRSQQYFGAKAIKVKDKKTSTVCLRGLCDDLAAAIRGLQLRLKKTAWSDYDARASYSSDEFDLKQQLVRRFIEKARPDSVWDLGANVGVFSRICAGCDIPTVSFDADPVCVETNYRQCRRDNENNILPLVVDLVSPSPSVGWGNEESMSLFERARPNNAVLALALLHHLAISNNVPFERIAECLRRIGEALIIEFVPKTDPFVQRLLLNREDIFSDYTQPVFEQSFGNYYTIVERAQLTHSGRVLYLMRGK